MIYLNAKMCCSERKTPTRANTTVSAVRIVVEAYPVQTFFSAPPVREKKKKEGLCCPFVSAMLNVPSVNIVGPPAFLKLPLTSDPQRPHKKKKIKQIALKISCKYSSLIFSLPLSCRLQQSRLKSGCIWCCRLQVSGWYFSFFFCQCCLLLLL